MIIHNDWEDVLKQEFEKTYMKELFDRLKIEYAEHVVYPPKKQVFSAFEYTPYSEVKVVILGQDPYHGPNQANGLSFSVAEGVALPKSLINIYKELVEDMRCDYPQSGDLSSWAKQGVLMLNTTLTVRAGAPMSLVGLGWETFTDHVLSTLNQKETPVVFILWGKHAQSKIKLIDQNKHFIIKSAHPSPLSAYRGFFGSKPFSQTNEFLVSHGMTAIEWDLSK
ncbi:MAG TPA: uracil-DNA glycosylase [Firmicutes bacterium]|nr:uracil-DNA glycosylase [Bacillota bacterium]